MARKARGKPRGITTRSRARHIYSRGVTYHVQRGIKFVPTGIFRVKQLGAPTTSAVNYTAGTYGSITTTSDASMTSQVGAITTWGISFTLADVPNISQLTSVFDQYRIRGIKFTLIPQFNTNQLSVSTAKAPDMYLVRDYDDNAQPTDLNLLRNYESCKMVSPLKGITMAFRPNIALAAYGAGAFSSYANQKSGWIDCGNTAVAHYGVKCGIAPALTGFIPSYTLKVWYMLEFKSVR